MYIHVIPCSGGHADAAGVDSLVIDQVVLDVDRTLLVKVLDLGVFMPGRNFLLLRSDQLLFRVRVSCDDYSGIGGLLQVEGNLIQAGLGFIVDARWPLGISCERKAA